MDGGLRMRHGPLTNGTEGYIVARLRSDERSLDFYCDADNSDRVNNWRSADVIYGPPDRKQKRSRIYFTFWKRET